MSLFLALLWQALVYSGAIFVGFEIVNVTVVLFTRDESKRRCKKVEYFSTEVQTSALRSAMWIGPSAQLWATLLPTSSKTSPSPSKEFHEPSLRELLTRATHPVSRRIPSIKLVEPHRSAGLYFFI